MKQMLTLGTDSMIEMGVKPLVRQGIISKKQYEEILKRNEKLSNKEKYDTIELKEG